MNNPKAVLRKGLCLVYDSKGKLAITARECWWTVDFILMLEAVLFCPIIEPVTQIDQY